MVGVPTTTCWARSGVDEEAAARPRLVAAAQIRPGRKRLSGRTVYRASLVICVLLVVGRSLSNIRESNIAFDDCMRGARPDAAHGCHAYADSTGSPTWPFTYSLLALLAYGFARWAHRRWRQRAARGVPSSTS